MKLFINHLSTDNIKEYLKGINHIDFSLFVDYVPKSTKDLSPINI